MTLKELYEAIKQKKEDAEKEFYENEDDSLDSILISKINAYTDILCLIESSDVLEQFVDCYKCAKKDNCKRFDFITSYGTDKADRTLCGEFEEQISNTPIQIEPIGYSTEKDTVGKNR